jgi:hypothetical protein
MKGLQCHEIMIPRRVVGIAVALACTLSIECAAGSDTNSVPDSAKIQISGGSALNLLGNNSCAASSCHGGARLPEGRSFAAYQIWMRKDPHSRAFEVLNHESSVRIMELLYPKVSNETPARQATSDLRCLNCHVTTELAEDRHLLPAATSLADGVGCESCHGPAKNWIGPHTTAEWRGLTAGARAVMGFIDTTADLAGRVQLCARCHVGSAGKDVNHDLIAAGHPRLNFEFSTFHADLPKHWNTHGRTATQGRDVESQPQFEARAWLVGQLVTIQTSLRLLKHRTDEEQVWPELSEHACFSCHHDLKHESWYQTKRRSTGGFAWGTWNYGLLPAISQDTAVTSEFMTLKRLMEQPVPERSEVRRQAENLDQVLTEMITRESSREYSAAELDQLLLQLIRGSRTESLPAESWDQTAQLYLAAVAITLASEKIADDDVRSHEIQNHLEAIRQELLFRSKEDSPRSWSDSSIETILNRLQEIQLMLTAATPGPGSR